MLPWGLRQFALSRGFGGQDADMGSFHYMALGYGSDKSPSVMALRFAEARVSKALCSDWLNGRLVLGQAPQTTVPPPTASELAAMPGGPEAWHGFDSLSWEACEWAGSKVELKESWKSEFQSADRETQAKFQAIAGSINVAMERCNIKAPTGTQPTIEDAPAGDGLEELFVRSKSFVN